MQGRKNPQFLAGDWLGLGSLPARADCAKRTQSLDCEFRIADWGRTCGGTPTLRPIAPACAGRLYKQTQLPWSGWKGQVLGGKGVMMSLARQEPWQNKANFEQLDPDPPAQLRKTKPNLGRMGHLGNLASGRASVQNKANFAGGRGPGGRKVRNEPNLPLRGTRPGGRMARPIVRSKANFEELAGGIPHHSTIPSFQDSNPTPFGRNKPNRPPCGGPRRRRTKQLRLRGDFGSIEQS